MSNCNRVEIFSMDEVLGQVVLAGDTLLDLNIIEDQQRKIVLGPGLRRDSENIIATKCGIVRHRDPNIYFIDNHQKRYVPVRGENVVGIVTMKSVESVKVDIGSSESATLSLIAFEGATKRNKPSIKVGDLVFAKILVACKDMEPEVVCVDSYGKSAGLGILPEGGFMFTVPLEITRKLLSPRMLILKQLGKNITYEIAVGLNGRVWVRAKTVEQTLVLCQAISVIEHATEEEAESMCETMFECITLS